MEEVSLPNQTYQPLIKLMDQFDDRWKGTESLRERVIRAIHQENWLFRYIAQPGQKVARFAYDLTHSVSIPFINSSHNQKTNLFSKEDNSTHITINNSPELTKQEKKEEKKEEDSRASLFAILGITTLTVGAAYALFYSKSRLNEIQRVRQEVEQLQNESKNMSQSKEPISESVECKIYFDIELHESMEALSEQKAY